jgi:hypothetical protein
LLALALVGCGAEAPKEQDQAQVGPAEGGQTGSASCDDNPPECVCDVIGGASILRGVVTEAQTSQVRVEVIEVYGSTDPTIVAGTTIGGSFIVGQPCGLGDLSPPETGLDVFVAFDPGPEGTDRLLQGWLQLMPYEDPLPITNQLSLATEDLGVLLDDAACREHFTSPEPFLCNGSF